MTFKIMWTNAGHFLFFHLALSTSIIFLAYKKYNLQTDELLISLFCTKLC